MDISLWFTGVLAVAGILQFGILVWTFRQIRDTAQRDLRAYVCVDSSELKLTGKSVDVQVRLRNCGKTPAYSLHGWINISFEESPLKKALQPTRNPIRKGKEPLGPGRRSTYAIRNIRLDKLTEVIIGSPACTLYVYGEVTYEDAFRKERYTKYRLIYGENERICSMQDKDGVELGLLEPDAEGNEAS